MADATCPDFYQDLTLLRISKLDFQQIKTPMTIC